MMRSHPSSRSARRHAGPATAILIGLVLGALPMHVRSSDLLTAAVDGGALRDDAWGGPPSDDSLISEPEIAGSERVWTGIDMLYVDRAPPPVAETATP